MEKDSGTRSGMLWEVERILNECAELGRLPQVLIMENVTQVHSKDNMPHFQAWIKALEKLGYSSYWKDLNAKDYGIPQNRDRTFMVSMLGDWYYEFPKKIPLELRLKDMLEDNVDEKFYLSEKQIDYVLDVHSVAKNSGRNIDNSIVNPNCAKTISCRGAVDQRADVTNFVIDKMEQETNVETLRKIVVGGDKVIIPEATSKGYAEANDVAVVVKVGNYSPSGHNASSIVDTGGIAPTVMENHGTITAIVEDNDGK